jgi:hypothetical protein
MVTAAVMLYKAWPGQQMAVVLLLFAAIGCNCCARSLQQVQCPAAIAQAYMATISSPAFKAGMVTLDYMNATGFTPCCSCVPSGSQLMS